MSDNLSSAPVEETAPLQTETNDNDLSLNQVRNLIRTSHLDRLHKDLEEALLELTKGQKKVQFLHKIMKAINLCYNSKDQKLVLSPELKEMLQKALEDEGLADLLKEVGLDSTKKGYSKEEKDRLLENCNWTVQDLNMMNDVQVQKTQRLTNERLEIYQLLRATEKPFSDAILSMARQLATR